MRCPYCSSEMAVHVFAGVSIDQCDHCPAIWLDAGEREALSYNRAKTLSLASQPVKPFVPSPAPPTRRCSRCGTGRLQPGTVGERSLLACTDCRGFFVPLPPPSTQPSDGAVIAEAYVEGLVWQLLWAVFPDP